MILVDANLLLYARISAFAEHPVAYRWLMAQLNGDGGVGLPWESLLAFMRIATNPRLFPRPLTMSAAWQQVEEWLDLASTWCPQPSPQHRQTMARLTADHALTSKLVMDAHLAAIALDHRLHLCSADADFKRFAGLRHVNPLR